MRAFPRGPLKKGFEIWASTKGPYDKRALRQKGPTTKGPYDKRALRQEGLVTKEPYDKREYRLKENYLKRNWSGLHTCQVKGELLLLLTADSYVLGIHMLISLFIRKVLVFLVGWTFIRRKIK
jgi:hypothetical protein